MFVKNLGLGLLASAMFVASSAQASNAGREPCVFDKYAPVKVTPFRVDEKLDYTEYSWIKGAQLYVPASEGLTREWLALSVQRALSDESSATCHPDVADVQVSVTSAGNGFWVQLIGHDQRSADTLLRWAQAVVQKHATPKAAAR